MILHFDCFAGISGDMTLGALVGLGVPRDKLLSELKKLQISGWSLDFITEERCGITGLQAIVTETGSTTGEHAHTHWSEIRTLIEQSAIADNAKKIALTIFQHLAEAEAEVHNLPLGNVAFHEVGAIDSIIDIVGTAICLDILKPEKITASEIELGGGTVHCAHGILPVPAPATLLLCKNLPVRSGGFDREMTTPTGAAILAACADEFLTTARWKELKTAYGIGSRKFDKPNVLRVSMRETQSINTAPPPKEYKEYIEEECVVLEMNIDDMTGEAFGFLMEQLFTAGALDVTFTPCVMKKSRPGTIVTVLSTPEKAGMLRDVVFNNSTTIGLREYPVRRYALRRKEETVMLQGQALALKKVCVNGKERFKIQYEDKAHFAREKNISLACAEQLLHKNF